MTRLVITGASGQLGRQAAEAALATVSPNELILVTRAPDRLDDLATRGAQVRFGDFDDPSSLPGALAGGQRMLLVSATDLSKRVAQHRAAIDAARAAGIAHLIYTSGLSPAPPNPAAVAPSHHATEQALVESGLSWTVLRNSLYAEYQLQEALRAIETGTLVHNRGDGKIAYVSREDCARAGAAVLVSGGHEGAVYDITGPEAYSAVELAALCAAIGGRPVEAVALDDEAFVGRIIGEASDDDHSKYGAELVASFGRSIREGYMASCSDAVERLTGRPARRLDDVLTELVRQGGHESPLG